jgi:hypothetical protein
VWKRVLPRCGNYGARVVCYLTNRWHFAAVCSVIDKQMMSWCGKNKKVALSRQGECGIYLLYVIKKLKRGNDKFVFKSFGALKHSGKVFAHHLTWCMIRTKQTTLLVRRASQRDVIVLGIDNDIPSLKWRQPFVCPLVDHSSWPMKRQYIHTIYIAVVHWERVTGIFLHCAGCSSLVVTQKSPPSSCQLRPLMDKKM